jgi:hypothetical protein
LRWVCAASRADCRMSLLASSVSWTGNGRSASSPIWSLMWSSHRPRLGRAENQNGSPKGVWLRSLAQPPAANPPRVGPGERALSPSRCHSERCGIENLPRGSTSTWRDA